MRDILLLTSRSVLSRSSTPSRSRGTGAEPRQPGATLRHLSTRHSSSSSIPRATDPTRPGTAIAPDVCRDADTNLDGHHGAADTPLTAPSCCPGVVQRGVAPTTQSPRWHFITRDAVSGGPATRGSSSSAALSRTVSTASKGISSSHSNGSSSRNSTSTPSSRRFLTPSMPSDATARHRSEMRRGEAAQLSGEGPGSCPATAAPPLSPPPFIEAAIRMARSHALLCCPPASQQKKPSSSNGLSQAAVDRIQLDKDYHGRGHGAPAAQEGHLTAGATATDLVVDNSPSELPLFVETEASAVVSAGRDAAPARALAHQDAAPFLRRWCATDAMEALPIFTAPPRSHLIHLPVQIPDDLFDSAAPPRPSTLRQQMQLNRRLAAHRRTTSRSAELRRRHKKDTVKTSSGAAGTLHSAVAAEEAVQYTNRQSALLEAAAKHLVLTKRPSSARLTSFFRSSVTGATTPVESSTQSAASGSVGAATASGDSDCDDDTRVNHGEETTLYDDGQEAEATLTLPQLATANGAEEETQRVSSQPYQRLAQLLRHRIDEAAVAYNFDATHQNQLQWIAASFDDGGLRARYLKLHPMNHITGLSSGARWAVEKWKKNSASKSNPAS